MKRTLWISLLCLMLLLSACAGLSASSAQNLLSGRETEFTAQTDKPSEKTLNALANFSLRLFQNSGDVGEEGALISPASVLFALGMTANGAQGETLAQLEAAFGLPLDELNPALAAWASSLPEEELCRAHLANAIWLRDTEDLTVEESFLDTTARYYLAGIYKAPFDESTLEEINTWVSDETDGMIDSILDEIPDEAMLYLVNALAFEAQWSEIYTEDQIHSGTFTAANGEEQAAELMYSTEYAYLTDGSATGFLKYYDGGKYAFAALLPDEGISLGEYVQSLTGEGLRATLTGALEEPVTAGIPKFEAETSLELSDTLQAMGVTDAFDAALADFSAMGHTEEFGLMIGRVLHKTYLAVDEQGTRAGAATAVEMVTGSSMAEPHIVTLDRPFLYLLVDTETGLPLFVGTVTDLG